METHAPWPPTKEQSQADLLVPKKEIVRTWVDRILTQIWEVELCLQEYSYLGNGKISPMALTICSDIKLLATKQGPLHPSVQLLGGEFQKQTLGAPQAESRSLGGAWRTCIFNKFPGGCLWSGCHTLTHTQGTQA